MITQISYLNPSLHEQLIKEKELKEKKIEKKEKKDYIPPITEIEKTKHIDLLI